MAARYPAARPAATAVYYLAMAWAHRLAVAIAVTLLCSCAPRHVAAPAAGGFTAPTLPEATASPVTVEVRTDVAPLVALIKAAAPRPLAAGDRVVPVVNRSVAKLNAHVRYEVLLADVALKLDGAAVTAEATIDFRLNVQARGRGLGGLIRVSAGVTSCGYGESMARVRFSLAGRLRLAPGPTLRFVPGGWRTQWLRPCRLGMGLRLDQLLRLSAIQGRVNDAITAALAAAPKRLDLAGRLDRLQKRLAGSHRIATGTWLFIRPERSNIVAVSGRGSVLGVRVRTVARLHIRTSVSYTALTARLRARFRDRVAHAPWTITGVRSYTGGGRLVVAVTLSSPVATTVYFVGQPQYTPDLGALTMRDGKLSRASVAVLGSHAAALQSALRDATQLRLAHADPLAGRPLDVGSDAKLSLAGVSAGASNIALTRAGVVVTTALAPSR